MLAGVAIKHFWTRLCGGHSGRTFPTASSHAALNRAAHWRLLQTRDRLRRFA
jgi:hypothetical protein